LEAAAGRIMDDVHEDIKRLRREVAADLARARVAPRRPPPLRRRAARLARRVPEMLGSALDLARRGH
jgi:hypothetical protein